MATGVERSKTWHNGLASSTRQSPACSDAMAISLGRCGLSPGQLCDATRLYGEGWSLAKLRDKFSVDDMTVRRYLLLAKVAMRSPHETHLQAPGEADRTTLSHQLTGPLARTPIASCRTGQSLGTLRDRVRFMQTATARIRIPV